MFNFLQVKRTNAIEQMISISDAFQNRSLIILQWSLNIVKAHIPIVNQEKHGNAGKSLQWGQGFEENIWKSNLLG